MIFSGAGTARAMRAAGFDVCLEDYYFQLAPAVSVVMAVFISLFLGPEYADGTIRNKLIAGHTRTEIYLANFLICLGGSGMITLLWFIGGLPGLYLIGGFAMGWSGAAAYFLVAVGMAAFSAVFVWIGTLSRNKALTVVLALIVWAAMFLAASAVNDRLSEREFTGGLAMIDGNFILLEDAPNPLYLSGAARVLAQWLFRLLPAGQAIAMTDADIGTPALNVAASLLVTAAVTAAGVLSFRKIDLK